jgi:hypothetical protein
MSSELFNSFCWLIYRLCYLFYVGKVLQLKDLQDEERRSLLHTYDLDQDSSLTL